MTASKCLFCQIIAGELASEVVWENDNMLAIRDINPQAPCHLLLIPKVHFNDITQCHDPGILGGLFRQITHLAHQEGLSNGFRIVINTGPDGGQTVGHLHIHLLGGRNMDWPPG